MITRLSQFFAILEANRPGFTAKPRGDRRGTIRRGGASPVEAVYNILTGDTARTPFTAATQVFNSARRAMLVTAAADAPSLLYLYTRLYVSTWNASGRQAAQRVENEWQAILGVRGQMLKALGLKETLRGDGRLPAHLIISKKEV